MATITSAGSGLWSAAGTWDAGVPLDGDDVIIASGHTVTFDVDQSAFVTGIGLTITGTLTHTLASGTYHLHIKTGASVTGAGTWNVGTLANPIPFASKHTITGAAGWYITGASGLTLTVYGAEPTYSYVKLSDGEALGVTVLRVDTDVTADLWADGDIITIANINKNKNVEERTIAVGGIAAGAITVTVGLTSAKIAGSYVCLITRNVRFIHNGTNTQLILNATNGKFTIGGGMWYGDGLRSLFLGGSGVVISGGALSYFGRVLNGGSNCTISGGVFSNGNDLVANADNMAISGGLVCGFINGSVYGGQGGLISGGICAGCTNGVSLTASVAVLDGLFEGNNSGINNSRAIMVYGGTFRNNYNGISTSVMLLLQNATFSGNTRDIDGAYVSAFNVKFSGTIENINYQNLPRPFFSPSIDHDQVSGAFRSWTKGGITTKQAVTVPTGYTNAMQTVLESADNEGFWQKEQSVSAGQSVNLDLWLRKDASMTYLPRVYIFRKRETDPFAGGSSIHTFTMTDSVDTWEHDSYTYANDGAQDETLIIRFQGKNASGNLYSALNVEVINVDLTSVLAHLVDIKGAAWTDESLASITTLLGTLATSAELAALNDLDPAGIRSAVGLAAANLDDQFLNLVSWAAINLDESITEGTIIQIRGNSWTIAIEDLSLSANKQQFAIKYTHRNAALNQAAPTWNVTSPDADSLVFIDSDTGLLYLNGVAAADPTLGSLSYVGTTLTVTLDPAATQLLAPGTYTFGIQSVDALGVVSEAYGGTFTITADIIRSIS
jgi:hypothetical protein